MAVRDLTVKAELHVHENGGNPYWLYSTYDRATGTWSGWLPRRMMVEYLEVNGEITGALATRLCGLGRKAFRREMTK